MALILALDVGTKTIGVALADPAVGMGRPLTTVRRKSVARDVERLADVCREQGATVLVVGLPLELDGVEGRSARLARQVGNGLAAATGLPLHYQDETYTTVVALERMRAGGVSPRKQAEIVDQVAAAVIVEDWLAARREAAT